MSEKATLTVGDASYELDVTTGSENENALIFKNYVINQAISPWI